MKVEQFVMAYLAEQDRLRAILPDGFSSLRPVLRINAEIRENDAHGVSIGKTLPAIPTEVKTVYPGEPFTVENAAKIPCLQVLGTYRIAFERNPEK